MLDNISDFSLECVKRQISGDDGYILSQISSQDLALIQLAIFEQYLHTIQIVCPRRVSAYRKAGLSSYHSVYQPDDFHHGRTWVKSARVLGPQFVQTLQKTDFFKNLRQVFGSFLVSDEENFGWPNVYWRLVRPGSSDIGPVHADKWFWDLGHGTMPQGYSRVKLWLAIAAQPGKSGLMVLPGSHKKSDWKYHGIEKNDQMKPVFDEDVSSLNMLDLPLNPGQFILFHDELLHGGMPNLSESTRVSLEFTLLVPEATMS